MLNFIILLSALSLAKALPFHKNPVDLMMKQSSVGGFDQLALQQTPEYQLIVGKLYDVLSKPAVVKILQNKEFQRFIDPKNLIKLVKGEHFQMLMTPEAAKAMQQSPLFSNIINSPEMKKLVEKAGLQRMAPKLPQIIPLLMEVFRERLTSRKPLPGPVEEFGKQLGMIPEITAETQQQDVQHDIGTGTGNDQESSARDAEIAKATAAAMAAARDFQSRRERTRITAENNNVE